MGKGRLEAFSDGVIAIIVTVMVLELKVPTGTSAAELWKVAPTFLSYALSFFVVAVMWVNHHQIIHGIRNVMSRLLWFNNNLLFWMSLIPFVTTWMGLNYRSAVPVSLYGLDLTLCASGYVLLRLEMARQDEGQHEKMLHHRRIFRKNAISVGAEFSTKNIAFVSTTTSQIIYSLIP